MQEVRNSINIALRYSAFIFLVINSSFGAGWCSNPTWNNQMVYLIKYTRGKFWRLSLKTCYYELFKINNIFLDFILVGQYVYKEC